MCQTNNSLKDKIQEDIKMGISISTADRSHLLRLISAISLEAVTSLTGVQGPKQLKIQTGCMNMKQDCSAAIS
jgi:hypothetical protein